MENTTMATITQETRLDLARHELVTVSDAREHTLRCNTGELWITLDQDQRDIILGAGETWRIDNNGPVAISALRDSTLSLCRRQPFGDRVMGRARNVLVSLLNWEFPPLASFPSTLIR
jgi:hypothetical protein